MNRNEKEDTTPKAIPHSYTCVSISYSQKLCNENVSTKSGHHMVLNQFNHHVHCLDTYFCC